MRENPMKHRLLVPEILDGLPPEDPEARRSRRDLRRINFLMGNERWIARQARRFPEAAAKGISELGAGEGDLCRLLARTFPDVLVTGYDLLPRPEELNERIHWRQGDVLSGSVEPGGILVVNLFLHHFEGGALERLMRICHHFDVLLFNEPERARLPHLLGKLMHPWINRVTRHDLHASLQAGFRRGEIPALAGRGWRFQETTTWRGAIRVVASRDHPS